MVESEAFRIVFDTHFPAVRRYVARRCPAADVDDVVAEVFTVAWRRWEMLPGKPLPWLLVTARRILANLHRAEARRSLLASKLALITLVCHHDPMPELCPDPELRAALSMLGARDREVLLLSVWDGLSGSEIAEVTGLSVNAVHLRLSRARRRPADLLAPDRDVPEPGPAADDDPGSDPSAVTGFRRPGHSSGGER